MHAVIVSSLLSSSECNCFTGTLILLKICFCRKRKLRLSRNNFRRIFCVPGSVTKSITQTYYCWNFKELKQHRISRNSESTCSWLSKHPCVSVCCLGFAGVVQESWDFHLRKWRVFCFGHSGFLSGSHKIVTLYHSFLVRPKSTDKYHSYRTSVCLARKHKACAGTECFER